MQVSFQCCQTILLHCVCVCVNSPFCSYPLRLSHTSFSDPVPLPSLYSLMTLLQRENRNTRRKHHIFPSTKSTNMYVSVPLHSASSQCWYLRLTFQFVRWIPFPLTCLRTSSIHVLFCSASLLFKVPFPLTHAHMIIFPILKMSSIWPTHITPITSPFICFFYNKHSKMLYIEVILPPIFS